MLRWRFADRDAGIRPTAASALDIVVDQAFLGRGISPRILTAMREAVARQGLHTLVAPVRPNAKHRQPHTP
ncbi:MAG TPA: N-acetyltransferase, partial [Actinopolymorphaceae bacterium]